MGSLKLTIVTPTHNRKAKLERLYHSLQSQTYKNIHWLIFDDGSTDGTQELVESWISEEKLSIEYHWHENVHKVITMFRAFEKVKTQFFFRVDSDDELPENSIELLMSYAEGIKDNDEIIAVIGRIKDQNGKVQGTPFPKSPYDTTAFLMRNRDKVQGPHIGVQKVELIRKLQINVEQYAGKGYLPDFWNYIIDQHYKTRFINDVVYTYHWDLSDQGSNTNKRKDKKYAFGMMLSHLNFVNAYYETYFYKYPLPILKQLFKYIYFSMLTENFSIKRTLKSLDGKMMKFIGLMIFPIVFLYLLTKKIIFQ